MKQRSIKIGILAVIFVLAVILFSYWINIGSGEMTADMGSATLPTITFETAGKEANMLVGHVREMNMVAMRDSIAVYGKDELTANIYHAAKDVQELGYEIYTLDGKTKLLEETIDEVKESVTLDMGDALKTDQEGILKITLSYGDEPVYYYTRVIKDNDYHVKDCIGYVEELHNNLLKKENEDAVKKVMEPNSEGNNPTLQHVTIHSDYEHVTWGNLSPKVVGEPKLEIKEAKAAYTSILLRYQVMCAGDNNEEELYNVQEFFKVIYKKERFYLLEYDRTMQEVFDTSNVVLGGKGVILGITEGDVPYKVNKEGTIVAFVQGNELWNYQKEEDSFALVFSFSESENEDERNDTDDHSIRILSMEENGNMTFSVSGYMNRGVHEGESGISIYYYNLEQNCVEEEAFIPSTESYLVIERELNELAYYNKKQDVLYVMSDGTLLKVDMKENRKEMLIENLPKGQYVASNDGHLLAYQKTEDGKGSIEIWDFAEDKRETLVAEVDETLIPLGFVGDDFVYGISKLSDVGTDAAGNSVQAMYALKIQNAKGEIVKSHQEADVYILGATIENNMITLKQGVKNGNSYKGISEDYITNNETSTNEYVELKSYWTDLKETQYRLEFAKGITDKNAKTLKPKQVLQEIPTVLEFEGVTTGEYFYVYGHGKQAGIFEEAGAAIQLAETLSGVVVSPKQNYVWESDNRVAWYRNFEISQFVAKEGESTLDACVRKALSYEGLHGDAKEMQLRDCSVKDMFYLMDKGKAVIALKDGSHAVMLVGYDAKTVTFIDPTNGGTYTYSIERMDEMLAGSGNTFMIYAE